MKLIDRICVCFVAGFFAFAGVDKALHLHGFINAINDYAFFPIPIGSHLAPGVIAAELMVAAGFMLPTWRRSAALLATILMSIFTVAIIANEIMGGRGVCGCWFSINMGDSRAHIALNVILTGLSFSLWRTFSTEESGGATRVSQGLSERGMEQQAEVSGDTVGADETARDV